MSQMPDKIWLHKDTKYSTGDIVCGYQYDFVQGIEDEVVENFAKSKREELEKMIPGFVDDRKFTDIVLNFYERGIRDGVQMMLDRMTENVVDGICISNGAECGASIESSAGMLFLQHNTLDVGDKVKIIIIKQ